MHQIISHVREDGSISISFLRSLRKVDIHNDRRIVTTTTEIQGEGGEDPTVKTTIILSREGLLALLENAKMVLENE